MNIVIIALNMLVTSVWWLCFPLDTEEVANLPDARRHNCGEKVCAEFRVAHFRRPTAGGGIDGSHQLRVTLNSRFYVVALAHFHHGKHFVP
ncbi:TPA: hypothetical protein ACYLN4_002759 [Burkholderia lata]